MYGTGILIWVYLSVAELVIAALLGWLLPYVPKGFKRLCNHHLVIAKAYPEKAIKYRAARVNWVAIFTLASIVTMIALVVVLCFSDLHGFKFWQYFLAGFLFMPAWAIFDVLMVVLFILGQNFKESLLEKYFFKKYGIKIEGEGII